MMKEEHNDEGERFSRISELSNAYQLPPDACPTYNVTFQLLKRVWKWPTPTHSSENNILFPAAILAETKKNK